MMIAWRGMSKNHLANRSQDPLRNRVNYAGTTRPYGITRPVWPWHLGTYLYSGKCFLHNQECFLYRSKCHIYWFLCCHHHYGCVRFELWAAMISTNTSPKVSKSRYCILKSLNLFENCKAIKRTLLNNKPVDHSDVVGAPPVGAAPTTSPFRT